MSSDFVGECAEDPPDPNLRQGDVFEWIENRDEFGRHGLVITADCDIALEKHRGVLSYVPVVPISEYLAGQYLPRRLRRTAASSRERFLSSVRQAQKALPEFGEPISAEALSDWVLHHGIEEVAAALGIRGEEERKDFIAAHSRIDQAEEALDSGDFRAQLDSLLALLAETREAEAAAKSLANDIEQAVTKLPGDSFFIGRLASGLESGYVAYLRHVREIQHREVATNMKALKKPGIRAKRISRLRSPFVYRLTQQLADVFAAIGLPTEYENQRRDLVKVLVDVDSQTTEA